MARLLRFAAVAVLVGGATAFLSGCTGDADPVVSMSPSVTAEVTPSPSPSVSVSPTPTALSDEELLELIPEDAREENFGSAANFARFFILEYDVMFQDRTDALFGFMSGADCEFCASALASYGDLIGGGGRRDGGALVLSDEAPTGSLNDDGFWYVGLRFTLGPSTDHDADGNVIDEGQGGSGSAYLQLERADDRWIVRGASIEMDA